MLRHMGHASPANGGGVGTGHGVGAADVVAGSGSVVLASEDGLGCA